VRQRRRRGARRAVYPLGEIAARYAAYATAARVVEAEAPAVEGLEAVALRVGIVHAFRRIVLRDPRLPASALPADWSAPAAHAAFARTYAALEPASDAWLEANARNARGPLPPPDAGHRFADGDPSRDV